MHPFTEKMYLLERYLVIKKLVYFNFLVREFSRKKALNNYGKDSHRLIIHYI